MITIGHNLARKRIEDLGVSNTIPACKPARIVCFVLFVPTGKKVTLPLSHSRERLLFRCGSLLASVFLLGFGIIRRRSTWRGPGGATSMQTPRAHRWCRRNSRGERPGHDQVVYSPSRAVGGLARPFRRRHDHSPRHTLEPT